MKIILSLLFILMMSIGAIAQSTPWCASNHPSQANIEFLEILHKQGYYEARIVNETIFIPMKIHIIRNSQGVTGFNLSDALRNMCELNVWFKPYGLQFYQHGTVNYIDNSTYYNNFTVGANAATGDHQQINPIHNVANVINVYYVNMVASGLCGFGNFPGTGFPSSPTNRQGAVYLSPSCSGVGNTTFAHEMGHHMSLFHPFQFTSASPGGGPDSERVTRNPNETLPRSSANCQVAGDRFCDTPADYIDTRWTCPRTHTQVDVNGDIFAPDPTLIMSYANDNCVNKFTAQQTAAMRATVTIVNGVSGPRRYWLTTPMPAYDTITSIPVPLEPAANATGIPNNFAFFKWRSVPGATKYILRLRFNFNTVEEIEVNDTSYLYTGTRLNGNAQYRWSVAAVNHKVTCINWTTDRNFTTISNGVGLEQYNQLRFKAYPTQLGSGEMVNLQFPSEASGEVELQLRDLHGRLIQSTKVWVDGENVISWPVQTHTQGVFLLSAQKAGYQHLEKLVIQQ
jgi:hypothetical protein